MQTFSTSLKLSDEELRFFDQEGYVVIPSLLDDADLQPVIDEVTAEVDRRAWELVASGELSCAYEEEDFEHRLLKISAETDKVALSIWDGKLAGPAFFELIRNPKLLDVAEQLCGPELIASSVYRLRPKLPGHRHSPVPWHQDSGYFEPYCDNALVLTVWLPLVNAAAERGCLWALPRQHKGKIVRHQRAEGRGYLEIPNAHLPPGEPVCVPVNKGGVLLLTNRTPHASFDNTSDIVRWSMDLRYQSAALPTNARITRLPHEAGPIAEENIPVACYPPEADFLVRSRLRPHEVVADPAEFHRIRKSHQSQPMTQRWE